MENYIEFKDIRKAFVGQLAIDEVSFGIRKGEVHALLGENGAGKSTLLNVFHGVFPASAGQIFVDGKAVIFHNTAESVNAGIFKVHQEISLVPEMTVAQNLLLGQEYQKGPLLDKRKMRAETNLLLQRLKCNFDADTKVSALNTGERQMLQIAKALHAKANIISFDEPTSSLSNSEVKTLFSVIDELKKQGVTIIYISHKLDEIYAICDRATIMRDGRYIDTFNMAGLPKDTLIQSMVGRNVAMFARRKKPYCADYSKIVMSAENFAGQQGYHDISFNLHKGEILGFFGLVGAKRTESMLGIFGATKTITGTLTLQGKAMQHMTPGRSIKNGFGLLPENRKEVGFIKDFSNGQNISLASMDKFRVLKIFQSNGKRRANALEKGAIVGMVPNDPDFMTRNLSGGNQQKVIVAKWLTTDADVLVFDEPTKGIDVGSKADIYALMEDLVAQGKSIIMISSELPEVMGMSDRIIVMHEGVISGELQKDEFDEAKILTYAVGGN